MAESDEEVDVEEISDSGQISHLRDLAEEDHKDNWYDKDIGNQSFLNSSATAFSSEYCDPNSWLLDTNTVWSLDNCTDDKSRATIEKMILEEQMYSYRSVPLKLEKPADTDKRKQSCVGRFPNVKRRSVKSGREPSLTHRKPWTTDEQELFEQGLKRYGRSWTKIANMIDTRTTLQVKNYAKQYFKQKNKTLMKPDEHISQGIEEQCDDTFVLSNIEEDTHENDVPEHEQTKQAMIASLDGTKPTLDYASEEDVEVDIDGSDNEEGCSNLIPGQTASCAEDVYAALVRAAETEENLSNSPKEEDIEFNCSEGNFSDVLPKDVLASLLKMERTSSVIVKHSSHTGSEEELSYFTYPSYSCKETSYFGESNSGEKKNSTLNDTDKTEVSDNNNILKQDCPDILTSELPFCEGSRECSTETPIGRDISIQTNASHATDPSCCVTLDLHHAMPDEVTTNESVSESGISIDSIGTNTHGSESSGSAVEKSWVPVTCGEVTCAELIKSSDREQPGANTANQNILNKQIVIDRDIIQDVEKEHHMEFFMGRTLKTPERYMKIRNYILDMWEKTKPSYLFKTAVRSGLRNCGDVNSIGRVHAFLEDIGAINEGCLDRPVPRVRQQGEVTDAKENFNMESWVNSLRPRKKRPRNTDGDWVDHSKPEGMTIQHLYPEEQASQDGAPNEKGSPSAPRKRPSRSKPSYDPFLLVPCRKFPSPSAVPFDVLIQSEALVVMDTHAHMSTTEVIGLLGGNYFHGTRLLKVSKAIPCRSLSTGLQCEMDPVSQTQASEDLAHRGLAVVGWYHSHPTFAPIPSVRDIETQAKFQEWFGKGGAPFIGIIVSPYNYNNPSNQSQIRCLTVSDKWESAGQYRLPYQFDYEVHEDEADEDDTVEQVRSIADDYRTYPFRVQLNRRFENSSDVNLLDKLLDSLRGRVCRSDDGKREAFLDRLRNTISENIKPHQAIQPSEMSVKVFPEN